VRLDDDVGFFGGEDACCEIGCNIGSTQCRFLPWGRVVFEVGDAANLVKRLSGSCLYGH
jgi:hypothetical protein